MSGGHRIKRKRAERTPHRRTVEVIDAQTLTAHVARVLYLDPHTTGEDTMTHWYVKSLSDHDTHRGHLRRGRVQAACGIEFTPVQAGLRSMALAGKPPDPEQICPKCQSVAQDRID